MYTEYAADVDHSALDKAGCCAFDVPQAWNPGLLDATTDLLRAVVPEYVPPHAFVTIFSLLAYGGGLS